MVLELCMVWYGVVYIMVLCTWVVSVRASIVTSMMAAAASAPPIIYHYCILYWARTENIINQVTYTRQLMWENGLVLWCGAWVTQSVKGKTCNRRIVSSLPRPGEINGNLLDQFHPTAPWQWWIRRNPPSAAYRQPAAYLTIIDEHRLEKGFIRKSRQPVDTHWCNISEDLIQAEN